MEQPSSWIRSYYKSFNGLRGIAVGLTFLAHYATQLSTRLGFTDSFTWVGVDIFFVLSGFLITGILLDSLDDPAYFRNFYIRRSLRILPLFYGLTLLLFLAGMIFHLRSAKGILFFPLYIGNLTTIFADLAHHNPTMIWGWVHSQWVCIMNIGPLWSLCVEEQFYLVWPAVIYAVRDHRRLKQVCIAMACVALFVRCLLAGTGHLGLMIYWNTIARCDTLLAGAWIALWLRETKLTGKKLRQIGCCCFWLSFVSLSIFFGFILKPGESFLSNRLFQTAGYDFVICGAVGLLLLALEEKNLWARFLQNRALTDFGIVSYGFYIFEGLIHNPSEMVIASHPDLQKLSFFINLLVSFGLAWLSFRFFESPFLRLKKKWAPQHKPVHKEEPPPYALEGATT